MVSENKLNKVLKEKNIGLYKKIKRIENILCDDVYPFIQLPDYTKHGLPHSKNIQSVISLLLPDDILNSMNCFEIFFLIASSLLHDIGMIKTIESNENINSVRNNHAIRSKEIIEREYEKFLIDSHEAEIIGIVCEAHCMPSLDYIDDSLYSVRGYDNPRIRFLAVLLRLGDILDVWSDRTSDIVYRNRIFNGVSKKHWEKHRNISNAKIVSFPSWDIIIYAKSNTKENSQILKKFVNNIQRELNLSKEILRTNGLFFRQVDIVLREELDYKKKYNNPFILLKSFTYHDTVRFAGRVRETYQVLKMIENRNIILIIGESGVGKTSLLNAGVLPKVRKELDFEIIEYSFSSNPTTSIINKIKGRLKNRKLSLEKKEAIQKANSLYELLIIISEIKDNNGVQKYSFLLVGDHLEQLFTLDKTFQDFINQVSKIRTKDLSTTFLFCIREDYLPQLFNFSEYIPELYEKENTFRLFKFEKSNSIEIFKRASEISYISLSEDFIDLIVDDLYTECEGSIYPPYLQIIGYRIYDILNTHKTELITKEMCFEAYNKLGGTRKIVTEYLSSILDKYKYEEKSDVAEILATMTTQYYTKKRISFDLLSKRFPHIINLKRYLNSLIKDRIIKRSLDEYELSHDFLAHKVIELINEKKFLSPIVRQAIDFIETNYSSSSLLVSEIASHIGVTPNHLTASFKKELDMGIKRYLNEYRISIVKSQLHNTREPLKSIALVTGFYSQNTLSRIFKKNVNVTPSEYRKSISEI